MTEPIWSRQWQETLAPINLLNACQTGTATLTRYANAFYIPFLLAASYFNRVEGQRFWQRNPLDNLAAYTKLGQMNLELVDRALRGSCSAANQFVQSEVNTAMEAFLSGSPDACSRFAKRINTLVEGVAYTYPKAIDDIEAEFGFHFERQPAGTKIDETDRFELYQVLPRNLKTPTRRDGKPLLIMPPFVLGANILSFLPGEGRSYAHAYADQGIPTYVRILKDVETSPAVQLMTSEDDARDTRRFCENLKGRHGRAVTLNGYCQGGFAALCDLLSGELDDLVDAFITCVAPMDGTRSKGLAQFLRDLPVVFNDLSYGTKILSNGNRVADGDLMGWIYKLKSIEIEIPLLVMWRDMLLVANNNGKTKGVGKTAAALNYWLMYERNDLPMEITRMSFASYNTPISADGILPVRLFGRKLALKRLQAKKIRWLICYGLNDDLVEPETALAPLDYVDAEVTPFPKGHVAIATSWSYPDSAYALHHRYPKEGTRGPVRFQLDLQDDTPDPSR
ncbi:metal transporter [Desulfosarcina ovata]|uniref:Metal transporter n=2 Tax=Desulfosarcina ovata TaxID=83564 RepID=A0A5K8AAK2_9BACT|nr:metal transporter [Desulfosarcina ovata]BBO82413.1 hypothetical protein DSCO28_29790 [Desulfosarcina ovata subsp. sediminis]BBO89617.1 hypothetical protein DSCOOX_27970 [Desulfosarcina ovata subsp. ovata]